MKMRKKVLLAGILLALISVESVYSLQNQLGNVIATYNGKNINIQETISRGNENTRSLFRYFRPINKLSKNDTYMINTALSDNYLEPGEVYTINWNYNFEYCLYQYVVVVRIESITPDGRYNYTWWDCGIYTYY